MTIMIAKHAQRHAEGQVRVGGRHGLEVVDTPEAEQQGQEVDRDQVHGVHQQHPDENRDRQRRHQRALAVIGILDLLIDERDEHFDKGLHLAGNAGGRLAASLAMPRKATSPSRPETIRVSR
jgi:hypothetical protein